MRDPRIGMIFDIQRFSIHDGPGIRTVVFFKGCGMACVWCQNPEAVTVQPELAYAEEKCIDGCAACLPTCPEEALRPSRSGRVDFLKCTTCGDCVVACPSAALRIVGEHMTTEELLAAVEKDRSFYEESGGGITLSGGEPVLHSLFLQEFLPRAKAEGYHMVLETAGNYPFEFMAPLLPHLDLILFDIKLVDPVLHRQFTSADNKRILENLQTLAQRGAPLKVRMPVIPGVNTGAANVAGVVEKLRELGIEELTLLRYNHLWEAKLPRLATYRVALGLRPPDDEFYTTLAGQFEHAGICASL